MSAQRSNRSDTVYLPAGKLQRWAADRLRERGLSSVDARQVAHSLVQTSLWGIDSHGIGLLPHYLRRLRAGSIEARPALRFIRTGWATGTLDGGHGLGIVVCHRAMREAMGLARRAGVGVVGCYHSSHCGAIGLYGRQAAKGGMIGVAFTHSDAFVAPYRGKHAFLGTNPICVAVPSVEGPPVCMDMATSATTMNRVFNARREGHVLPEGLALDGRGRPTTDAGAARTLLPMAAHKGYALAFLIELLCGPLNGMSYGPHVTAMYGDLSARRHLGSLMMAIDPRRFAGGRKLAEVAAQMAREARGQTPVQRGRKVLVPGDPEYLAEKVRLRTGIPIEPGLHRALLEVSELDGGVGWRRLVGRLAGRVGRGAARPSVKPGKKRSPLCRRRS